GGEEDGAQYREGRRCQTLSGATMPSTIATVRATFAGILASAAFADVADKHSTACWLVTPAEAAQILGKPELANGETMHDDYATCDYLRAGFDAHLNHGRTVANRRQPLDHGIKSGKLEPIAGVGDKGGFDKSAKQPSLVAITGTHVLAIRLLPSGVEW